MDKSKDAAVAGSEAKALDTEARATDIIRSYMGWSAGAGLVPIPWLDLAAIIGVQLKMLKSLADLYGVPFRQDLVRPAVTALVSTGGSALLAGPAASLAKTVPVFGTILGVLTMPALAAAASWATGKVFIRHFESGGTFLDFDPAKARAYYAEQFGAAPKR